MLDQDALDDLLRRVAAGDQASFEELFDSTVDQVYGLILSMVGEADAEAVARTVYVDLWRGGAERHDEAASALTWVLGSAHRVGLGHVLLDAVAPEMAGATVRQRAALHLAAVAGHPCAVVADVQGTTPIAVAVRIRDALIHRRDTDVA